MHKAWSLPMVLALTVTLTACPGDDSPPPAQQPPGGGPPAAAPALDPNVQLPPGVTAQMVSEGRQLYSGICASCHGAEGRGQAPLGPALNDQSWIHITGEYEEIVNIITTGVPQPREYRQSNMPPMGGANYTPEQVRAIAAYVYSISHGG